MAMSPGWDNELSELSLLNTCEEGTVISRVQSLAKCNVPVWPNPVLCSRIFPEILPEVLGEKQATHPPWAQAPVRSVTIAG